MADPFDAGITVGQFVMTSVPSLLIGIGVFAVKKVFGDVESKLATLSLENKAQLELMRLNAEATTKKLDEIKEAIAAQAQATALHSQKIILMDYDTNALKVVVHDLELKVEKLTAAVDQLRIGAR